MYAIIRAGGKQTKVQAGDVIDIERVKDPAETLTFVPVLVVDDSGTSISDRTKLAGAKVVAEVMGESRGDKIDIFKYKNKSGYRRHMGHRQTYTRIRVTSIDPHDSGSRFPRCWPPDPRQNVESVFRNAFRYRWNWSVGAGFAVVFVHVRSSVPSTTFFSASSRHEIW